jgi:hypothetical protein
MPFIAHRVFGWEPVVIDEAWGLNTIQQGNAYSVCRTLQCDDCEFVFLDIRFSDYEMARLYDGYRGKSYSVLREQYEPGYGARNEQLDDGSEYVSIVEQFLQPYLRSSIRILDWGGDTGKNTPFKGQNEVFDIYDISNKPVISGARRVDQDEALRGDYSLIVCANVLEHVSYPLECLCEITRLMKRETVLYVEVPFEGLMKDPDKSRFLRKKHWHEHINFFSESALQKVTAAAGLEIVGLRTIDVVVAEKACSVFQLACKKV